MSVLNTSQLAAFNTKTGFIIKIKNDAHNTDMKFNKQEFVSGERYPPNKPSVSGITLNQRGDNPIYHYMCSEGSYHQVNGAIRYQIKLNLSSTSLYMCIGFNNEDTGNHGFYFSLMETSSHKEFTKAEQEAYLQDGAKYYHGMWRATVAYEKYPASSGVKQINVTFSNTNDQS